MKKKNDISKLVYEAPEDAVKEFLIGIMQEDPVMEAAFKRFWQRDVMGFDKQYYKEYIDGLIMQYADRTGFINYKCAYMFFDEVEGLLYNDAEELLNAKKYDEAFELSAYICYRMENIYADDSDGGLIQVIGHCFDIWRNIAMVLRGEKKREFFDKIVSRSETMGDITSDIFDDFIINEFDEKAFLPKKIEFANKRIAQFGKKTTSHAAYMRDHWVAIKLELLEEAGDLTLQEQLRKEYWDSPGVKLWYVDKCIEAERFEEAIYAMMELIIDDGNFAGADYRYKEKLKEIYKIAGKEKEYTEMLIELAQKNGNLDAFYELKDLYYPEKWREMRGIIIEKMPENTLDTVFYSEKMDDRLLEYAVNHEGLFYIEKYKLLLVQKYPEAVLEKYIKEAEKSAMYADQRSKYKAVIRLVKTIMTLPGGKEKAKKMTERWKNIYSRRTAMMEELNKLKI